MPKRATLDTPIATPILPALDIRRDGIYLPSQVIEALGLRASSLRSEHRAGRLKIRRRCGRNFLLGSDLLAWLADAPEPTRSPRPDVRARRNGTANHAG